jgi:hypothetical protein
MEGRKKLTPAQPATPVKVGPVKVGPAELDLKRINEMTKSFIQNIEKNRAMFDTVLNTASKDKALINSLNKLGVTTPVINTISTIASKAIAKPATLQEVIANIARIAIELENKLPR